MLYRSLTMKTLYWSCVLWLLIGNPQRRSPVNNHKEKRQITLLFSTLENVIQNDKQTVKPKCD
nr:MAG TPA_asm: SMR Proline-rich submaxillary gland androgen-regulated family [Caudoviricetes sp.]